jgi:large subunit ribosomal protein L29
MEAQHESAIDAKSRPRMPNSMRPSAKPATKSRPRSGLPPAGRALPRRRCCSRASPLPAKDERKGRKIWKSKNSGNSSPEELDQKIADLQQELFELRRKKAVGQLEHAEQVRSVRKDIAKAETMKRERELQIPQPKAKAAQSRF